MDRNAFLERLDELKIREYLVVNGLSNVKNVDVFSSIPSTNDYLLESALANKQISVCLSEQQTKGRGRYGHQWVSPSAANLYISMSWPFQVWKQEYETLSLWLLISIAELLEQYGCNNIQLKWPNDLCFDNKKLAGVLIDRKVSQTKNALIIGVGLNVAMSLHNDVKIDAPWVDLLSIKSDWELSRNELAANIISSFYNTLMSLEESRLGDLNDKWQMYDMLLNERIEFLNEGKIKTGCVKGIDDLGNIFLSLDGSLVNMHSAHVSEIKIIGNT
ncbi:MAG: biotin--[acetyl-CoA-carboxylase] ligase [Gammaproteobacteria bacterium]